MTGTAVKIVDQIWEFEQSFNFFFAPAPSDLKQKPCVTPHPVHVFRNDCISISVIARSLAVNVNHQKGVSSQLRHFTVTPRPTSMQGRAAES